MGLYYGHCHHALHRLLVSGLRPDCWYLLCSSIPGWGPPPVSWRYVVRIPRLVRRVAFGLLWPPLLALISLPVPLFSGFMFFYKSFRAGSGKDRGAMTPCAANLPQAAQS